MHKKFLQYLADPHTGESLSLETTLEKNGDIIEGALVSKHNRYPIVRGVPRFAGYNDDANYTKSFGYQWNRWSKIQFDSHNVGKKMEDATLNMWNKITGVETPDLQGRVVVDFGCGPGRFLETIRRKNGIAIGLDLSDAVEAAAENFAGDENVLVCQGDILHPPFKKDIADGVFSIGVLHHTENPQKGFNAMTPVLKTNGWISVSVYSTGGYYDNFFVNIWRKIFKALWPIFGHYPPLIYSYVTVYTFRPILKIPIVRTLIRPFLSFTPFLNLPDIGWSVLNTFDSVTPSNQVGITPYQTFQWFKKAGLQNIEPSNWAGSSFTATK